MYPLHLAWAAVVGASFFAISAFYMHRKTLKHLQDLTKTIEKDREEAAAAAAAVSEEGGGGPSLTTYRSMKYGRAASTLSGGDATATVESLPSGLQRLRSVNATEGRSRSVSFAKKAVAASEAIAPLETVAEESNGTDPTLANGNGAVPERKQANIASTAMLTTMIRTKTIAPDVLRKEPEQEEFVKLQFNPNEMPSEDEEASCITLQDCLAKRKSYVFREAVAPWQVITDPAAAEVEESKNPFEYIPTPKTDHYFKMEDGVVQIYANKDSTEKLFPVTDAPTFFADFQYMLKVLTTGDILTLCYKRLELLEQKFNLHMMLNSDREFLAQKSATHRDFYNVRKVDTHVHHSACMAQLHLLTFIKDKLKKSPDDIVMKKDGKEMTLKEVFDSLDLTGHDLNIDLLDVHADQSTFHRFDKFNLKYNPAGQSDLRTIFMKQDNYIDGRYLAEITHQVFRGLEESKFDMAEYRISVYGRKRTEWDTLAEWVVDNNLYSENVVWLVQIPRLYDVYKSSGLVTSFQDILDNVFLPLFEVTVDPESHPKLHVYLKQVVGLDLVDDESKPERRPTENMPTPLEWNGDTNPAFAYWSYYAYANLYTLNKLRESKGLSVIKFRPHCGEAGEIDHLASSFLLAHAIAHGINLRKAPVLQYLYYLDQIGLAVSPLSNNSLFLEYHKNPFPKFFLRGLNVSLSTDDPLQIHFTKQALVEEYSVAASVWKLSSCDLCEIARNSVLQSGFSHAKKSHWLGKDYYRTGPEGNDIRKTNVPFIRLEARDLIWREEMDHIYMGNATFPQYIDP